MKIKNFLQKRFINLLVHNLYNTITADDILAVKTEKDRQGRLVKRIYLKRRALDRATIAALKEDAGKFSNSSIWKLMSNKFRNDCNERMFYKGMTADDILAGKAGLLALKTLEEVMEAMKKM